MIEFTQVSTLHTAKAVFSKFPFMLSRPHAQPADTEIDGNSIAYFFIKSMGKMEKPHKFFSFFHINGAKVTKM